MTRHRLINVALIVGIFALYALMAHLDGPSDHQAQADQLASLQAAVKREAAETRFTKAIAALCGENASARRIDDVTVQCLTKRGHKTQQVKL